MKRPTIGQAKWLTQAHESRGTIIISLREGIVAGASYGKTRAECKRYIPLVVENVKGAQPWVGRARWHAGPYFLWGDVPTLMPMGTWRKGQGTDSSWFYQNGGNGRSASSKSKERKEWTANVAKIPFDLANHVAKCFKPT